MSRFGSPNPRYTVRLWDCADKKIVTEIALGAACMGLAFTEDSRTLASYTGNPENRVALWRVPAGTRLASYPVSPFDNLSGTPGTPFALARQGNVVAVAPDNTVHLIDLSTGKERWAKTAAEEWVKALALSSDGSLLASGAGFTESAIRLWDTATGREITRLQGHRAWVSALVFWPDGTTLASAGADQTIHLWDLSDLANVPPPRTLRGHNLEVWRLALLPDGRTLASGCKDGSVCLWDTASIQHERSRVILPERVGAWRLEPDGLSVLTVDLQGRLTRWKGTDFRQSESLLDLGMRLTSVGWPMRYSAVFSRSGRQVAVGSTNGVIKVWDVQQRRLLREFPVSSGRATPLEFLMKGNRLAVFYQGDSSIHDWDLTTGVEASAWPRTVNGPFVASSQDARWSLALNSDGTSVLREMTDGRETNQRLDFRRVNDVAFTPDARLFSAASGHGYAKLWDRATFRELAVFRGFLMGVHSVAFSPDGRRIAFGGDGSEAVKLWDVESRQELLTLEGQGSLFRPTAFSADGNVLGSCNVQGWLHLWRAPSWDEIEATEKSERGTKESSERRRTTE